MDISEYKNEFVSESQDHLEFLNGAILILEQNQDDEENINGIFRAFHTLKGNAATLGLLKFSELAHSLEDILSKIRNKEIKADQNTIDVIFRGCDRLEEGLDQISEHSSDDALEVDDIVNDAKEILHEKEETFVDDIPEALKLKKTQKSKAKKGEKIKRLIFSFDPANFLKGPKSTLLMRDLAEENTILNTIPKDEDIRQGKFNKDIEIDVATKDEEKLNTIIGKITGVTHFLVLDEEEKYEKPKHVEHAQKEQEKASIADKHKADVVKQINSVKVNMNSLDKLVNIVGELLISNIRIQDINQKKEFDSLKNVIPTIDRLILDLQDEIMSIRMVPIGNIFNRFPRMVRDLANKENKKVDLEIEGGDIEFDRTILDQIGDPLVHLLRNSVDHGIETSDSRLDTGKDELGKIKLVAMRKKNNAVIEITDDGAGIDTDKVRDSSISKGIITEEEASKMTKEQLQMLIFRPGLSTNKEVTEVSGRGVGMDVVMSKIKQLGGTVKMSSELGKGTTVSLNLPLTLAIISGLLIKVNEKKYVCPLNTVYKTVDIETKELKTINGQEVFIYRNQEIPVFWLQELFKEGRTENDRLRIIIIQEENSFAGIIVDEIISQQQVLIKPLQSYAKNTKGVAGATILGDGSVALILDVGNLLENE